MISLKEALEFVLAEARPMPSERISTAEAAGRSLAEAVRARFTLPAFDNSAMDGYALRAEDTLGGANEPTTTLPLAGEVAAGAASPIALPPGHAMRIFTGAPIPEGANAVVMQERCEIQADPKDESSLGSVTIRGEVVRGAHIRPRGDELEAGQRVLKEGQTMGPIQIAVALAQGRTQLSVRRRPRVAILSSGDELVEADQLPSDAKGQVISTNSLALAGACQAEGALATVLPIAADRPAEIAQRLEEARGADLILSSGGVSVGDHDYMREVLAEAGFEERFWRVAVKPGKPALFGRLGSALYLGLPGNPVSALTIFFTLGRPLLRRMLGLPELCATPATLGERSESAQGRELVSYATVRVDPLQGGWIVHPLSHQASHRPSAVAQATHYFMVPSDRRLESGERVLLWPI